MGRRLAEDLFEVVERGAVEVFALLVRHRVPVVAVPGVAGIDVVRDDRSEVGVVHRLRVLCDELFEDVAVAPHAGEHGHDDLGLCALLSPLFEEVAVVAALAFHLGLVDVRVCHADAGQDVKAGLVLPVVHVSEHAAEELHVGPVRGVCHGVGEDLQVVPQVDGVLDHVLDELVVVQRALAHLGQEVAVRGRVPQVLAVRDQFEGETGRVVEGRGERLSCFSRRFGRGLRKGAREVEVVGHGAFAVAEVELCRERAGDVVLGAADRRLHVVALREVRGDGARERATGAVGVRVVDPLAVEPGGPLRGPEQVVRVIQVVSSLEQDVAAEEFVDRLCGSLHVRFGLDGPLRKHFRFRDVRGDDVRELEEFLLEGVDRLFRDEPRPAGGDHDGVDHDVLRVVLLELFGDGRDEVGRRDHPDLHRVREDVCKDLIQLLREEVRGALLDGCHAGRVLRGQGRDGAHRVNTVHGHRFDVRLNAGASAGIGTSDR